jgi:hypothetical protein
MIEVDLNTWASLQVLLFGLLVITVSWALYEAWQWQGKGDPE